MTQNDRKNFATNGRTQREGIPTHVFHAVGLSMTCSLNFIDLTITINESLIRSLTTLLKQPINLIRIGFDLSFVFMRISATPAAGALLSRTRYVSPVSPHL